MKDPREEVGRYLAERVASEDLADGEIEALALLAEMPLAARIFAGDARSIDDFLRGLPDDLLDLLGCWALDFFDRADGEQPETWPVELYAVTALLFHAEAGYEVETDNAEMSQACARLSTLAFVERGRRLGPYSGVGPYTLICDPEVVPPIPVGERGRNGH